MGLIKFVLVFALFAPVCHTLKQPLKVDELKTQLLRLLDVQKVPTNVTRTREQIPTYLLEVFKKESSKKKSPGRTMRAFFRDPNDSRDPSNHLFTFNITGIKPSEKINRASLRIFKRPSSLAMSSGNFEITVYRLASPWREDDKGWKKNLVYLDSKLVESRKNGEWIAFNVTSAVEDWANFKSKNYGLWVSVRGVGVPSSDFNVATGGREDPFLVEFGVDQDELRKVGEVKVEGGAENEVEESIMEATRAGSTRSSSRYCQRHTLYVNFRDLGWQDWVIAPTGYHAYLCKGRCAVPMAQHLTPTNHAVIQNFVHLVTPNAAPAPCCVPTELSPMSMLYFEEGNRVVKKDYQDMIANSCGCR